MPNLQYFGGREKRQQKSFGNRAYYRTLIDLKKDPCLLADIDGDVLICNQAFAGLSQYSEEELHGVALRSLILKQEGMEHPMDNKVITEFDESFYLLLAGGWLLPVRVTLKEIEGQKYLVTFEKKSGDDVAGQTKTNLIANSAAASAEMPIISNKLELVSNQSSVVFVHDDILEIRTQISALYGTLRLIEQDTHAGAVVRQRVGDALRSLDKLKVRLLDSEGASTSGRAEIKLVAINLKEFIKTMMAGMRQLVHETGMEIMVEGEASAFVLTDEQMLSDALTWVLKRALRFCRGTSVIVNLSNTSDGVCLTVDNIGLEFSIELINRIKKPGSDRDTVFLAQLNAYDSVFGRLFELSRQAGFSWDLELQKPGKLLVRMNFESVGGNNLEAAIQSVENKIRSLGLHILVVEDDRINAKILEEYLKDCAEVFVAYSGNEALNILELTLPDGKIDVVLMDFSLPLPYDGLSLRNEMIRRFPQMLNAVFIAQTAASADMLGSESRNEFSCVMQKPIDRLQLLKNILAKHKDLRFENSFD